VERRNHFRDLQFIEGQEIFAVQYTSIHKAAIDGSVDAVKFFLSGRGRKKGGADAKVSCDDWDNSCMSAIHYAAERGFDHVIEMLIEKGSDVNVKNGNGNTAVMLAAKEGHAKTIEILYDKGADISMKNKGGMTAAHFAVQSDFIDCLRMLVEKFALKLHLALARFEELEQQALVGSGALAAAAAVDNDDDDQSMASSGSASMTVASASVSAAASITGGVVAAITAVEELSEEESLQELLKLQPESILDVPSLSGCRAIHLCGDFGATKCLQYILSLGIDPNSQDSVGETAMHKAARKSYFDVYSLLKSAGGKEHVQNSMRESPHQLLHDETRY
jgi:ankyrin repeat protein